MYVPHIRPRSPPSKWEVRAIIWQIPSRTISFRWVELHILLCKTQAETAFVWVQSTLYVGVYTYVLSYLSLLRCKARRKLSSYVEREPSLSSREAVSTQSVLSLSKELYSSTSSIQRGKRCSWRRFEIGQCQDFKFHRYRNGKGIKNWVTPTPIRENVKKRKRLELACMVLRRRRRSKSRRPLLIVPPTVRAIV